MPRLKSCGHLMLEGGRRHLPASFLPLLSCLCSLSPDKVGTRSSSSASSECLPYIAEELPQPAWSHCSMARPTSLFLYAFHRLDYLPPCQDLLPKPCAPLSPLPLLVLFLSPYPHPAFFSPQHPELGVQHRSEGGGGHTQLLHSQHGTTEPAVVNCTHSASDVSIASPSIF